MSSTKIKIDTRELDRIVKGLNSNRDDILVGLAFEVERMAKGMAPVDTGTLRNSIYTRGKRRSSSPGAVLRDNVAVGQIPAPSGNVSAVVGSGVEYAAYQEFGTYKMASQPFLGPAVEYHFRRLNSGELWVRLFK